MNADTIGSEPGASLDDAGNVIEGEIPAAGNLADPATETTGADGGSVEETPATEPQQ